jgi:hypothetical protein
VGLLLHHGGGPLWWPSLHTDNVQHTTLITLSLNPTLHRHPTQHATVTPTPSHPLPLLQHIITLMPTPLPALNPNRRPK